ncbi:hypothetical protein [Agromyces humi]|uniref:hypothetical protein n=1 Tax=Agromyces humi TaxID=1766800 RepID=UPI00135B3C8B|nr:hypothetical protein [Agromyces humi]
MQHLDLPAAESARDDIASLPPAARAEISAHALSTVDYTYWLKKAAATAVAADPDAETFLSTLDPDPGVNGPAVAALVEPLIGRGVHRAQLWLLTGAYDGHLAAAAA